MYPAVKPPKGLIARPVDFKLKPGWWYEEAERAFIGPRGARFVPPPLPKKTRVDYKVPALAKADRKQLSKPELDLQRYMHVVLPASYEPEDDVAEIESWPSVEEAHAAPEVSLPGAIPPGKQSRTKRSLRSSSAIGGKGVREI